eukprot:165920_1
MSLPNTVINKYYNLQISYGAPTTMFLGAYYPNMPILLPQTITLLSTILHQLLTSIQTVHITSISMTIIRIEIRKLMSIIQRWYIKIHKYEMLKMLGDKHYYIKRNKCKVSETKSAINGYIGVE